MKCNPEYCPTCTAALHQIDVLDIYCTGYQCENGHRYFIANKEPYYHESAQAHDLESPSNPQANDAEIIRFWLTDETARSSLNSQLAHMISRILEIIESDMYISQSVRKFKHCIFCKGTLEDFPQDDDWSRGIKCQNEHEFYERGGTIYYQVDSENLSLSEVMDDGTLDSLITQWLENNSTTATNLHPEIKGVIKRFQESHAQVS